MNIVGLALPLLAQHGPINSSVELDQLVRQLIDSFLPWEKFRRPGLKSCPNLAKADAVTLHVSSEVEPILDIGNTWKGQGEVDEEEGQVSGLPHLLDLVDNEEETGADQEPQVDTGNGGPDVDMHLEYVKGLVLRMVRRKGNI